VSVVPFAGYDLCRCGNAVGLIPVRGEALCEECFDAQRPGNRVVMVALPPMPAGPSLEEILQRLTGAEVGT
jgi:hypothetical protein